ncbi:MAG: EscU/YscU/HrcU family type III secretion system export apparatus switch protein [gamma proteobacterium symbiont of Taylorina sp.]|nr:EscU/YscU/HrcU family type III secretion system export apparatus switch protein [gamma proteobacterium symbiont of Taylorina sp.]
MNKKAKANTDNQSEADDNTIYKQAIALNYNEGGNSNPVPKVTATGQNEIAEQIITLAKEHGIPIHEDPELAVLLSQLELYEDIPESLYHVVAEVLAFAYIVAGKMPKGFKAKK